MADTVLGNFPNARCDDCGTLGCAYTHWGPMVPSSTIGHFCPECMHERREYYNQHGSAKPYPTKQIEPPPAQPSF